MDKVISDEERIRRAEEISARRNNRIPVSNINVRKTKKISTLSKVFIQVICSICIFGIFYFINQNNSLAIEKIRPILSEDTDFMQIYTNIDTFFKNISNSINNENSNNEENINNEVPSNEQNNEVIEENEENKENNNQVENNQNAVDENNEENKENIDNETVEKIEETGVGGGNEGEKSQTDQDIDFIKANASFIKPLNGTITSAYGQREPTEIISANHAGVDIGANTGSDIIASMQGTVKLVSSWGDYGNHIEISNGEITTLYAHCSKIVVNEGDYINQGQKIAEVGSTGKATGPHLHFEIRRNNKTVDPQKILDL